MKSVRTLFCLLLLLVGSVFATQSLAANDVLHIYAVYDPSEVKMYIETFMRDTKINVEWSRLSSGDLLNRLKAEAKNPQASVWFGGPSSEFVAAKKAGVLAPYKSPEGKYLKGDYCDNQWYWSGFDFGAIGFACNINWFQKNGLPYPTSWQDLLKPEFKGQISVAYPYTSGTSATILASLVTLMGEDKAFEYWKKLDANIAKYNNPGAACVTQVGLGENAIGLAFSNDILSKGITKGYPIKMTFPKEGTGFQIGAVALVKKAPEEKLAKKFIDWALSKRAQDLLRIAYRIPLNPQASVADGAVSASEVKLVKGYDAEWAGNNQERLNQKWKQVIGK